MPGTDIDYVKLIDGVLGDEKALEMANRNWRKVAGDIYERNQERNGLRVSDAGRCVRELWADYHSRLDIPESAKGLQRMRDGQRSGAENACLIVAGIERWLPFYAKVEVEILDDGVPGHADVIVYDDTHEPHIALEVVECKRTMWTGGVDADFLLKAAQQIRDPLKRENAIAAAREAAPAEGKPFQCIQSAKYALGVGAPHFVIVTDAPATMPRNGPTMAAYRYATADWAIEVDAEYMRLDMALADEMPEGDPKEAWRCKSCRFAGCERNENPLRKVARHA